MQKGNQLVTNMTKQIDIKKVDKLKDDMEDQQAIQDELNEALCQPTGMMNEIDDDDLEDELNALDAFEYEQEMLDPQGEVAHIQPPAPEVVLPAAPQAPVMPPVQANEETNMDKLMSGPPKTEEQKAEDAELEAMWNDLAT